MRAKDEPPITALLHHAKYIHIKCIVNIAAHLLCYRDEITATLADIRTLTTHDDNIERQYRESRPLSFIL
jgi:hypothetical protein